MIRFHPVEDGAMLRLSSLEARMDTVEHIIEDIKRRILYGQDIVGNDTRALPPVEWAKWFSDDQSVKT